LSLSRCDDLETFLCWDGNTDASKIPQPGWSECLDDFQTTLLEQHNVQLIANMMEAAQHQGSLIKTSLQNITAITKLCSGVDQKVKLFKKNVMTKTCRRLDVGDPATDVLLIPFASFLFLLSIFLFFLFFLTFYS
jgi:hypothetical protein